MTTINGTEYIRTDDSVESLVKAGVIPEWIARDAISHGMYIAEYILCEFDWEWGWDLGDGYSDEQWQVLKDARKRIQQGINNYHSFKFRLFYLIEVQYRSLCNRVAFSAFSGRRVAGRYLSGLAITESRRFIIY